MRLSWLETKLGVLWLFLPLSEDIAWIKKSILQNEYKGLPDESGKQPSRFRMMLHLILERIKIVIIYFRNFRSKEIYKRIDKYLITPNE